MNLDKFLEEYGEHIVSYKEYETGTIRFTFADSDRIMWLKGRVCEELDLQVMTSSRNTYWFVDTDTFIAQNPATH